MSSSPSSVLLKPNVLVEPVFAGWYAHAQLIAPHLAALRVANSHLPLMKSFVSFPQGHMTAVKTPGMLGGPFLSLDASHVKDVQALIAQTERDLSDLVAFAAAIKAAETLLLQADGTSLEPLYARLPEPLRGF